MPIPGRISFCITPCMSPCWFRWSNTHMEILNLRDVFKQSLIDSSFPRMLITLLAGFIHSSLAQEVNPGLGVNYTNSAFVLPPDVESMVSVDLNADTYPDFLAVQKDTLTVYLQQTN